MIIKGKTSLQQEQEELEVDYVDGMSVTDLKMIIGDMVGMEDTEKLRIVTSNGKLLKNGEEFLSLHGVNDSSVLYMSALTSSLPSPVNSSFNSFPSSSSPSSKAVNINRLNNGNGGDFMKSMLDNMDPSLLQQMFFSNPKMQQLMEKNPELQHVFSDSKMIKQMVKASMNPDMMLQLQKSNDLAMAQLENIPGGFQALSSFYKDLDGPLSSLGMAEEPSQKEKDERNRRMAELLHVEQPPPDRINNMPLPNPWAPPPRSPRSMLTNAMPFAFPQTFVQPNQSTMDMKQIYSEQLRRMKELGFHDEEANLRALIACGGNLEMAVEILFPRKK